MDKISVKLFDDLLDGAPPMLDGALVAIHVHIVVVLRELALVELALDSRPIGFARLIGIGARVAGHNPPRFNQTLVLLGLPTDDMVLGALRLLGFTVGIWFTLGAVLLLVIVVVFFFPVVRIVVVLFSFR